MNSTSTLKQEFVPAKTPSNQNAQIDSLGQLDQRSHTKHYGKELFGNLLKLTRSEL